MREAICCSIFAVVMFGPALAGDEGTADAKSVGRWVGATNVTGSTLQIDLMLRSDGSGQLDVYFEAPMGFDYMGMRLDVKQVSSEGEPIRFEVPYRDATLVFTGKIDGPVFHGNATGGGQPAGFRLFRCLEIDAGDLAPALGFYQVGKRRFGATWREYGDLRWIDLDSGQGTTLIPVGKGAFLLADTLTQFPSNPGRVEMDGNQVRVVGSDGAVTGKRLASPGQRRIRFNSGDVSLSGTLMTPDFEGPHPAVVLVHGSGPIYRTALFERAAHFTSIGIAALIYDKRGTGQSSGDFDAGFDVLAADVVAAVHRLRKEPDIDASRIGLQGHSQAGFVIPMAAAQSQDVAFAMIVSSGPITPAEQSLYDKKNDLRREGYSATETEQALSVMRQMFRYVVDRKGDRAKLEQQYLAAKKQSWFETTDLPDVPGIPGWDAPPAEMLAWREELTYDSASFLARLEIPLLFIFGTADETVPPERTAELVRQALSGRDASSYGIEMVPGADHGLRIQTGHGQRTLAPSYVDIQRKFLEKHDFLSGKSVVQPAL